MLPLAIICAVLSGVFGLPERSYVRLAFEALALSGCGLFVTELLRNRRLSLDAQERFRIFCTPCHGELGDGRGIVVQRGFNPPPSFHNEELRQEPIGHFFDVMTRGHGTMYSYAARIPPRDRWAIAAYIRALQLSQHAVAADLPADDRSQR